MAIDNGLDTLVGEIGKLMAERMEVDAGSPEDDLLATGVLDSLTLIELLTNLEVRFQIRIRLEELEIENIHSISAIARMVENYKLAQTRARPN
jgi:acyl carrier protein